MKRKKYYYLDPVIIRIPGIKTLFEKSVGKRDARQNQVCSNGEVHTTPFIDAKVNSYNAHIEKLLLKTTNELAPMIQEANSLLVEYSLMESHKGGLLKILYQRKRLKTVRKMYKRFLKNGEKVWRW